MFVPSRVVTIARTLGLTKAGVKFVQDAVLGDPSRLVGGGDHLNVSSHYPSQAMGSTRQTESHTVERLFVLDREYEADEQDDGEMVGYFDQLPEIPIETTTRAGRRYRGGYKADYLVVHKSRLVAQELKTEQELQELCKARPKDWIELPDGGYRFLPAHRAYRELGIEHEVVSSAALSAIRGENIQLLLRARRDNESNVSRRLVKQVKSLLQRNGLLSLTEIANKIHLVDLTPLIKLIDQKAIHTDLKTFRLSVPDSCWVSLDPTGARIAGKASAFAHQQPFEPVAIERIHDPKERQRILSRIAHVHGLDVKGLKPRSERTLRRYRKDLKEAGGNPSGLSTGYHLCGRKGSRLSPKHRRLLLRIRKKYASPTRMSIFSAHRQYIGRFEALQRRGIKWATGTNPIVYETFRQFIYRGDVSKIAEGRGGRRARNAVAAPSDPALRALPPSRPFQMAHLDHFLADQFVVVVRASNRSFLIKPWISFLIDSYTKELLGFTVSLSNPSRMSCARVLRDCVRRHGRLPEAVITDSGAEFRSCFFHEFLAEAIIEKFERPVAAGRWGQEVERHYGAFKTQFLNSRPGNTTSWKSHRSVSRRFRPHNTAEVSLEQFWIDVEKFHQWHGSHAHGKSDTAPSVLRQEGLKKFGCSGVKVKFDHAFAVSTSVPAARKSYKFDPARGVRLHERWYYTTKLAGFSKRHVENVRPDPEDDSVVYILVKGCWHQGKNGAFKSRSATSLTQVLSASLRARDGRAARQEAKRDKDAELGRLIAARNCSSKRIPRPPTDLPRRPAVKHRRRRRRLRVLRLESGS